MALHSAVPRNTPASFTVETYGASLQHAPLAGRHITAHTVALPSRPCQPASTAGSNGPSLAEGIVVYQAYSREIAEPAATHQDFVTSNPCFKAGRMTWIKPNFMWMMHRCGWASKPNQERVLAITLRRVWWDAVLRRAVLSSSGNASTAEEASYMKSARIAARRSQEEVQSQQEGSNYCQHQGEQTWEQMRPRDYEVVVQWDPMHSWDGTKLAPRAIQVGIRGEIAREFAAGVHGPAVLHIEDITPFVQEMHALAIQPAVQQAVQSMVQPAVQLAELSATQSAVQSAVQQAGQPAGQLAAEGATSSNINSDAPLQNAQQYVERYLWVPEEHIIEPDADISQRLGMSEPNT